MRFLRIASALALATSLTATAAEAYTLDQAAHPASNPPSGYSGDTFVDNRGCIYVRATIGNTVNWVPRLSSDRKTVICGQTPTPAGVSGSGRIPAPPAPPPPTALASAAPTMSAPTRAVPPTPAPTRPVAAAAPASADIRTMSVTCPADGSTARVRIGGGTVGVRCAPGRTRAQSFIVRSASGERTRLIARPAAPAAAAATPVAPVNVTAAAGTNRRIVHAGDVLAGGRVVIGGRPGTWSNMTTVTNRATTTRATRPLSLTIPSPTNQAPRTAAPAASTRVVIPEGYRPAWQDGRLNPERGPRSVAGDLQMASILTVDSVPMRAVNPVPANGLRANTRPGFFVFSSKSPTAQVTAAAPAPAPAAAPTTGGMRYRYVQVGMFAVSSNATRAAAKLRGLGLPGRVAQTASGKTVVIAGPYDRVAALNEALATARRGFPDAFARN